VIAASLSDRSLIVTLATRYENAVISDIVRIDD
jgi:hypothetical protein